MAWASDQRLWVSLSHPERDAQRPLPRDLPAFLLHQTETAPADQLSRSFLTTGVSFTTSQPQRFHLRPPGGSHLGLTPQARFPKASAPPSGTELTSALSVKLPNRIQSPELTHGPQVLSPCNRIGVAAELGSHLIRVPVSPPRFPPLLTPPLKSFPDLQPPNSV